MSRSLTDSNSMSCSTPVKTSPWIKICGVCDIHSALVAVTAGADAIGLNFVPWSKRLLTVERAKIIADELRGRVELVGVVEDMTLDAANTLRRDLGLDRIQLHYDAMHPETTELPAWAYPALGIAAPDDVSRVEAWPGSPVLVDACVAGKAGGTGITFDWTWVVEIAKKKRVILAGGLSPDNVGNAVGLVHPWGVDVASGVEIPGLSGTKDPELVTQFIRNARSQG